MHKSRNTRYSGKSRRDGKLRVVASNALRMGGRVLGSWHSIESWLVKGMLISWAYEIIRSINWVGFHLNKNTQIYNHSVIHVSFGFQTNSLQESPLQMPRNMKPRNPPFQLSGTSTPNRKRASSSPCSKRLWASACGVEQKGKTSLAPVKVRQKIVVFYLFFQIKEPTKDYTTHSY